MSKKKEKELEWKNSKAKKLLWKDLMNEDIPLDAHEMSPEDVYLQRPEFSDFPYEQFRDRLNYLRKRIIEDKKLSASDSAALAHDRRIHPKKATNHRGEPRWEGSEAERLLKLDMDNKKHEVMKPKKLHQSRKEYYENYPLSVFRGHIYQEEKSRKFMAYWKAKQAEKEKAAASGTC